MRILSHEDGNWWCSVQAVPDDVPTAAAQKLVPACGEAGEIGERRSRDESGGCSIGEVEQIRVPAEIWRSNATSIQKLVMTDRDVARFVLDPRRETADGDLSNNVWPPEMDDRRFRVNASGSRDRGNPMRTARDRGKKKEATAKKDGDAAAGESAGDR